MYTIIWQENDGDRWDRFESRAEVKEKLKEIENNPEACELGDVWVFGPKADEYANAGDEFILD